MDYSLRAWLEAAEGDDSTFVETAFRTVLRRPPDEEARARAASKACGGDALADDPATNAAPVGDRRKRACAPARRQVATSRAVRVPRAGNVLAPRAAGNGRAAAGDQARAQVRGAARRRASRNSATRSRGAHISPRCLQAGFGELTG